MAGKKGKVFLWLSISVLILSTIVILDLGSGEEEYHKTRSTTYCSFSSSDLSTHYYGDAVAFNIRITKTYSGEDWEGTDPKYYHDDLYNVTLAINPDGVRIKDGPPVPGLIKAEKQWLTPNNGMNGEGFTIMNSHTYTNTSGDLFSMYILGGPMEGQYEIPVIAHGKVRVDEDATDPSGYFLNNFIQVGMISFHLKPNIGGVSEDMEFFCPEMGSYDLYAGSKNVIIRAPPFRSMSDTLMSIEAKLSFMSNDFYIYDSSYKLGSLSTYNTYFSWNVDVLNNAPPGRDEGMITFIYTKNDNRITEGPYNIGIMVSPTPLLIGPDTKNMTQPTVIIDQKTTDFEFEVAFKNIGNVDLEKVTLSLDIDSSNFIRQSRYYYDEDQNSSLVYHPLEFTIDNVKAYDTFTAKFPVISIFSMIPPGDYLIPVDYRVSFFDPSVESTIRQYSYQWDEVGYNDFLTIMHYREDPRPTDLKKPHFMLRILDDEDGADVIITTDTTLMSGSKNNPVQFKIMNRELYNIENANIEIRSSDPLIVRSSTNHDDPGLMLSQEFFRIPASTFTTDSVTYLTGLVDIADDASSGAFEFTMTIDMMDNRGNQVNIQRIGHLQIKAKPGMLTVTSIQTSKVQPGDGFQLTVNLINSGHLTITEFNVMLCSFNNMISVNNPISSGNQDVLPGGIVTVNFECTAGGCMDYESTSALNILTRSNDLEGNSKEYEDDPGYPINITATIKPESLRTEHMIMNMGIYFVIALIIATLIFSSAILISVFLVVRSRDGRVGDKDKKDKEKSPPIEEDKKQAVSSTNNSIKEQYKGTSNIEDNNSQQYQESTQVQSSVYDQGHIDDIFSNDGSSSSIDDLLS